MSDDTKASDAIETDSYPTLRVGSHMHTVKFRCGDIIGLQTKHDLNVFKLFRKEKDGGYPPLFGVEGMLRTFLLLSYGIAHEQAYTPEELANLIDFEQMPEATNAVNISLLKALAQAAKTAEKLGLTIPTPIEETPAVH
jgi:hypothetical protein